VVFDCLGSNHLGKTDVQAKSIRVILEAMKAQGIKRIIVLGASGSLHPSLCHATFGRKVFFWIIRNTLLKHPMNDSGEQQRIVEASDTDFTIVLPPRLMDEQPKGQYRVDDAGLPKDGRFLSRADLATFMLSQVGAPESIRRSIYVAD
jgi:putative NADH-flavin reductase